MNRTTCVGAADIAVIISSLMHHVLSTESSASGCAFRERVGELVDFADRLENTSESDRHRLAIARSLLELSLPASTLEILHNMFQKYIVWPPRAPSSVGLSEDS